MLAAGSPDSLNRWAPYMAHNGYAVFAIRYRLSKPGIKSYPTAVYDVKAAVQFVRAKAADLQTEVQRQSLLDSRNNIARDVRNAWQDSRRAFERLSVTQQLRQQADLSLNLAQARYNLGLGSIVEFTQAELQKTEADIDDTDAKYQYRLTEIVLAYTISAPK